MEAGFESRFKKRFMAVAQLVILIVSLLLVAFAATNHAHTTPAKVFSTTETVQITLSNSQPEPTPANFDQLLKVDWANYQGYLVDNVSNVRFYGSSSLANSTELYAWLETNDSWTANSSYVWVRLSGLVVPANGTALIYMSFLSRNVTWGQHWGLAPNLTSVYGEYDNGARVFEFYDNFSGGILSDRWYSNTTGTSSISVDNGLNIFGAINYYHAVIETNAIFPMDTLVQESLVNVTVEEGAPGIFPLVLSTTQTWVQGALEGAQMGLENSIAMGADGSVFPYTGDPGMYQNATVTNNFPRDGVYGLQWSSTSPKQATFLNNNPYGTSDSSAIVYSYFHIAGWVETGRNGQGYFDLRWISASPGAPDSIMPTSTFSSHLLMFPVPGVLHYFQAVIPNRAKVATANPYDQEVLVYSYVVDPYESSGLGNVIWFTKAGEIIPSWIESGASNDSTYTRYWLKIPFSVESNTTASIYIGFVNKSINLFSPSGDEGEFPNATSTYGQYDNGAQVFPFYTDFAGNTLSTDMNVSKTGSAYYHVDNGITLGENTTFSGVIVTPNRRYSQPLIVEADLLNYMYTGGGPQAGVFEGLNANPVQMMDTQNYYPVGSYSLVCQDTALAFYAQPDNLGPVVNWYSEPQIRVPTIIGMSWISTGSEVATFANLSNVYGGSFFFSDSQNNFSSYYMGIFAISGYFESTLNVQWLRAVIMPPDYSMPIVFVEY